MEGLIGVPFLHHYLNHLLAGIDPSLQNQIHSAADGMALQIRVGRVVPLAREDFPRMFSLPLSIDLSPMLSIPPQLQFLLMVNLIVPSQTNVTSIMKCLKQFSTQMISIEEAIEWIGHFDATIKSFFRAMVLDCEPASLSLSKLKSAADKQIKSKSQQQWALTVKHVDTGALSNRESPPSMLYMILRRLKAEDILESRTFFRLVVNKFRRLGTVAHQMSPLECM
jgi:hypothetical protein